MDSNLKAEFNPNIFDYATSELSQDAFIAWLISWADPKYETVDSALHRCGRMLIDSLFIKSTGKNFSEPLKSVKVSTQYSSIDILARLNNDYAIVIEDKVGTKEHSDQLAKYKQSLFDSKIDTEKCVFIYFKTGDQCDYQSETKAGYIPFLRHDFLEVLDHGLRLGVKNDIFTSFQKYLAKWEHAVQSYDNIPVPDWDWNQWIGFYKYLGEVVENSCTHYQWDYVPNASGGFHGFWCFHEVYPYWQIEEHKFCIKIYCEEPQIRSTRRNFWFGQVIQESQRLGYSFVKPPRFGCGTYMTVAVLSHDHPFPARDQGGILNKEQTLSYIQQAENIIKVLIKNAIQMDMPNNPIAKD